MAETNSKNDYLRLLFNAVKGVHVSEESELRCEKCGTINPPSSHYCRHCGRPLAGEYIVVSSIHLDTLEYDVKRLRKDAHEL